MVKGTQIKFLNLHDNNNKNEECSFSHYWERSVQRSFTSIYYTKEAVVTVYRKQEMKEAGAVATYWKTLFIKHLHQTGIQGNFNQYVSY